MAKVKSQIIVDETLAHILHLRDRAIELIRANGKWQRVGATPVMCIKDHGNLSIAYLTPFQRPEGATQPMSYGLEIRAGRRVVLSLSWNRVSPLFIHTYRSGAWEAKLGESSVTASLAA